MKEKDKKLKQEEKKKGFTPPGVLNNPKPFQQFSTPNKFTGPKQQFTAFHRRLNTRRSGK